MMTAAEQQQFTAALGIPPDSSEEQIVAAVEDLVAAVEEMDGRAAAAEGRAAAVEEMERQIAAIRAETAAAERELEELVAERKAAERSAANAEIAALRRQALADGLWSAGDPRAKMFDELAAISADRAREYVEALATPAPCTTYPWREPGQA